MHKTLAKIVLPVTAAFCLTSVLGQTISIPTDSAHDTATAEQDRFAVQFRSGDTNAPLLSMDWFSGPRADEFCRVNQNGAVTSARNVINWAIQGGHRISLDTANMFLLVRTINGLPLPSNESLPQDRQINIGGIRSNQWFQCVYDRANVPEEVERLYEITGAYLEWFMPIVGSHPEGVQHGLSQHDPSSFAIARDTPFAISLCANIGLQIWNVNGGSPSKAAILDGLPYPWKNVVNNYANVTTISPDGRVLIYAAGKHLLGVGWKNQKVLWDADQLAFGNLFHAEGKTLALDNRGQSLYLANGTSIEHWNWADGTKLRTLATNNPSIKFLQTSWDGGFLIAGFADNSFTVWNTDTDEPVSHFIEPGGVDSMAISPDGKQIVLNSFGQNKLVVYDWQRDERKEFPLRTPYASSSAYSMCFSPDGKRLAAEINTYPSSVIIYETEFLEAHCRLALWSSWKPFHIGFRQNRKTVSNDGWRNQQP